MRGGFVVPGQGGHVFVALGSERGAGVDDVDFRRGWGCGGEADVDGGDHDTGHEVGVYEVASVEIEEGIDPGCADCAVLDGEDGALFVVRGWRI